MWIDGAELALVSEALASLAKRRSGLIVAARDVRPSLPDAPGSEAPGPVCPRCAAALVELAVVDVPVDVCTGCGGVWLDGGEYQGITAPRPRRPPPKVETIACRGCGAHTPLAESFYTDEGLVCRSCNEGVTPEAMRERAIATGAVAAYANFAIRSYEARGPTTAEEIASLRDEVDTLRYRLNHR